MGLVRECEVDRAHYSRVLWKNIDQAFFLETQKSIPNGGGTEPELLLKRQAVQNSAGGQAEGNDHFPQPFEHLRCRLAAPLKTICSGG
jgi:hypothetical protein